MSDEFDLTPSQKPQKASGRWGILAVLALLFAKFKFLLFGLLKIKTLLSMVLFFAVYWHQWGWPFALGFVLSIYIHEMGHVAKLKSYGIQATAPLFIPFVGAFIRVQQSFSNPIQDARVGLAGPFWGLGAAGAAWAAYLFTQSGIWSAIAHTGAWINLFNLIPFWQLDGGRGFHSLNRSQRWIAVAGIGLALTLTREYLLLGLLGFALFQAFRRQVPAEGDNVGLFQYVFLVLTLSLLSLVTAPLAAQP
jgi:Zn-dependent protease